jgi:hypothetical protein
VTGAFIRLIQKWLKAGILENGIVTTSEMGTGQGSVASPLLANVYLHYVFDLWAKRWRQREARGDMIIVRYADDIVIGFEYEVDALRFWDAMRERLKQFALTLHPDKTRLIEFGRFAAAVRIQRGLGKPETFTFLRYLRQKPPGQVPGAQEIPTRPREGGAQKDQGLSCCGGGAALFAVSAFETD